MLGNDKMDFIGFGFIIAIMVVIFGFLLPRIVVFSDDVFVDTYIKQKITGEASHD